jgi:hypothetical protein
VAGIPFCYWRGLGLVPGFLDLAIVDGILPYMEASLKWRGFRFLYLDFPVVTLTTYRYVHSLSLSFKLLFSRPLFFYKEIFHFLGEPDIEEVEDDDDDDDILGHEDDVEEIEDRVQITEISEEANIPSS